MRSLLVPAVTLISATSVPAADLSSSYEWNPVRIGAGGFVTGYVSHPSNPEIRYCRTDVGNAYRWDTSVGEWIPMIVRHANGTGMPADVSVVPGFTGCSSVAIDPSNPNVVLMAFPIKRTGDVYPTYVHLPENVYRSTDGGRNFTKGNLSVPGDPNGSWRSDGERLKVDPNNGNIVYYCSYSSGLYRSLDGGITWGAVTGGGAPVAASNPINVFYHKNGGTTTAFGKSVSSVIYVIGGDTDVFRSADGGQTWTNISTGTGLSGHPAGSTLHANGDLWVPQRSSVNLWKYNGAWTSYPVMIYDTLAGVAVDPANPNRIFVISNGGAVSRSITGGTGWTHFGRLKYANTLGWLPQPGGWRSNGGIYFDAAGELWVAQGNEGILRYMPTANNSETKMLWTIFSQGIEQMVTDDIIIPKGGGGKVLTAVGDAVGQYITDPDTFSAVRLNVQNTALLTTGNSIAVCPNATSFVAILAADFSSGANYSAYSTDTGLSWTRFTSNPATFNKTGAIAVSCRNDWGLGSDHIVILPCDNKPPYYSTNGGATWTRTNTFPVDAGGRMTGKTAYNAQYLKQHPLKADPFVPDKFYLNFLSGGFWVSINGGVTWTQVPSAGIPAGTYHGQLEVNYNLQDDLWFADGLGGTNTHGLFHSPPGSGHVFTKVPGVDNAHTLALGAGRGQAGDAPYTVYFYGKLTGDPAWGVFRSTNGGLNWDRISYYPAGLLDWAICMAASWDTFGQVYVGFNGNSYVYGKPFTEVFNQDFNSSTSIATYTGTGNNQFTSVSQATEGGFSITANNELLVTHGTDSSDHGMKARDGNFMNTFTTGFICKGTIRAVANPNEYGGRVVGSLRFGRVTTPSDFASAVDVSFVIGGTAAAPTVRLQPTGGSLTSTVGSATGTPFWLVVNKTGASVNYTRPDGQTKTLANNQYDLWFGSNGNSGASVNRNLYNPNVTLNAFMPQINGYNPAIGAAVAFDDFKISRIDIATTQF